MSFTETTTTSWFSRLKGALVRILVGFILLIACVFLLFWNEGRSVKTYRALVEGAGLVVSVGNDNVDPANEGKLVHISGPVKPVGVPQDNALGISAEGAAGLEKLKSKAWASIELPRVDPFVAPILYAIPVQLLAYHAAVAKGTDVDQPRNLAKSVTVE